MTRKKDLQNTSGRGSPSTTCNHVESLLIVCKFSSKTESILLLSFTMQPLSWKKKKLLGKKK